MNAYGSFTLLYGINQYNIVKQLSCNLKQSPGVKLPNMFQKVKKKKKILGTWRSSPYWALSKGQGQLPRDASLCSEGPTLI